MSVKNVRSFSDKPGDLVVMYKEDGQLRHELFENVNYSFVDNADEHYLKILNLNGDEVKKFTSYIHAWQDTK